MHRRLRLACSLVCLASLLGCGREAPAPPAAGDDPVAAWEAFCDQVKARGAAILRDHPQEHAIDRDEGTSYLAQQLAHVVFETLIGRQTAFPLLRLGATTVDKWGLDGADAKYTLAVVEAGGDYRLVGRLGTAKLIAIQLYGIEPEYTAYAALSGDALAPAEDGGFELRIAAERPAGWQGPFLPLDPHATMLLVREYFADWEHESPSSLRIERLDGGGSTGPAEAPAALLGKIADSFDTRARMWLKRADQSKRFLVNEFHSSRQENDTQGLADNVYGAGWFRIAEDQALVIELEAPDALLWSFQLGNAWWESLDYVNATGSLNDVQAVPSSDGRYRIVIALEDPGVPNWLDPSGHTEGMMLYRFQRARTTPEPTLTLVPVAELAGKLPPDTPRIGPEQRRAEIAARRAHAARRWEP